MLNPTVAELQKELTDLKIRVNNLEKRMSSLTKNQQHQRDSRSYKQKINASPIPLFSFHKP
jgi:uncharacterized protein YlxW (UPF0749 family)